MMLLNNYEPIPSDSNNDNGIKSFKNESNYLEYKRNYITSKSSYLLYSAGQDEHLVKLKIPKLDPKISYIPDASSIRYNHPDLEKVRDVYDYFKNDHQAIEEPTNDNEFFQQMLNAIKKPKFSVTIVGYHPTSKLNLNYYNDISMGENWKMECTHMSRFKTPTFKIQINMENIVNEQWTELCVDNIYSYATEIPTFNKIIDNYVKSRKPIKKIELMTKVIFENRMEFESEIQKMFLSVGYYDKIEFIYHTSKSGVKIEKGKNFQEFNDNLCWTLCIWMYMWWIIWYPIMWCISGTELPPMIAYYQARIDMNLLRCIQPLILEGASQKDLCGVTIEITVVN